MRVPDAVRRATLLRRAGTHPRGWTPDQQRTAARCVASGAWGEPYARFFGLAFCCMYKRNTALMRR